MRKRNICLNPRKRDVSQRAAANCEKRTGIESRTGRAFVFSALSGFHVFSRVAWPTHGNSDVRSADGNRWEGIYMREFYRASPAFGFDGVLFFHFFFFFSVRHRDFISEKKTVRRRGKRCPRIIIVKIFCV